MSYSGSRSGNNHTPVTQAAAAPLSLQQHQYEQHYHQEEHLGAVRSPAPDYVHNPANDPSNTSAVGHGEYNHHRHAQDVEDTHHGEYSIYENTPEPTQRTKGSLFRVKVMSMATVRTLRILWGLLALFGTMSWLTLMPAYAFRNKHESNGFSNPAYSFFLVATVITSIAAIWQSLCPYLIQLGPGSIWPRIIDHAATQAATIVISAILTVFNLFSWIVLAVNKDGAKTKCNEGPLFKIDGYTAQCRAVNVAIVLNAIVFILWIPIALVIVCGLIETMKVGHRAPDQTGKSVEYDLKRASHGYNASVDNVSQLQHDEAYTQKPAYVTPIASQFAVPEGEDALENGEGHHSSRSPTPQQQHHLQQHHLQQPQRLRRMNSNASMGSSIVDRLSGFFGAGWQSGQMPPPPVPEPEVTASTQTSGPHQAHSNSSLEVPRDPELDKASINGDAYVSQWHSRRQDDWS